MSELREGVRVIREVPAGDDEPWLMLSGGSELLQETSACGLPYLDYAVVPRDCWRVPAPHERALLEGAAGSGRTGQTVTVLRVPEAALEPLRELSLGEGARAEGETVDSPAIASARAKALEQLAGYCEAPAELRSGVRVQRGGLRTATAHRLPETGIVFIGLHVDRWHDGGYGCTEHAQLSINVGTRDRFFTFLNLPVQTLTAAYGDPIGGWLTIGRDFVARHDAYPFVRIRLRPGEAYVAPTENLVHDVSFAGSDVPDVCFNLHGRFRLPV